MMWPEIGDYENFLDIKIPKKSTVFLKVDDKV